MTMEFTSLFIVLFVLIVLGLYTLVYFFQYMMREKVYYRIIMSVFIVCIAFVIVGTFGYMMHTQPKAKMAQKIEGTPFDVYDHFITYDEINDVEIVKEDIEKPLEYLQQTWEYTGEQLYIDFSGITDSFYIPIIIVEQDDSIKETTSIEWYESTFVYNEFDMGDAFHLADITLDGEQLNIKVENEEQSAQLHAHEIPFLLNQFSSSNKPVDFYNYALQYGKQVIYITAPQDVSIEVTNDSYVYYK